MKLESGSYIKASEVRTGDAVTFLNEGEWVENARYTYDDGRPRQDFVIKVSYKGEQKKMRLNKTNRDTLIKAYTDETSLWVGKSARIVVEKMLVAGKKQEVITLEVPGSEKAPLEQAADDAPEIPF